MRSSATYGSTDTRSCAWWHWIAGTGVTHADDVLVAFFETRRIPFPGITERGGGEGWGCGGDITYLTGLVLVRERCGVLLWCACINKFTGLRGIKYSYSRYRVKKSGSLTMQYNTATTYSFYIISYKQGEIMFFFRKGWIRVGGCGIAFRCLIYDGVGWGLCA